MKKALLPIALIAACAALSADATPIRLDGPETNLQQIVNAVAPGAGIDVVNDQYALDEAWRPSSVFGSAATIVMEIAGYANLNRLGVYDITDPTRRVELFSGAASSGASAHFTVLANGDVIKNFAATGTTFASDLFGFYLETPVGLWFSQSSLNADQSDHMVAYRNLGSYLLGWEDSAASKWDQDYNDFVVMVSGIRGVSVPEPASLGLLGLGLAGLGVFGRRRKQVGTA